LALLLLVIKGVTKTQAPSTRTMIQSILHLGHHILWCEVVARGRREYEVHVVPQWDMSKAVVELFNSSTKARRRHAELCWLLAESGWDPAPTNPRPSIVAA
jgi:hypothetical protein